MNQAATDPRPMTPADWAMLHPIFARCVGDEGRHYDLSRPFVIREYIYATDSRIAVRMPAPDWWDVSPPPNIPHQVARLFEGGAWRDGPTEFPPVVGPCSVCDGAKVLPEIPCPWCLAESPGPYEAGSCDECWQLEGRIPAGPCYECAGTGLLDARGRIEVAPGYWLQGRYVALLHEFEMATYLPVTPGPTALARFGIGDITGLLMPMTAPRPGDERSNP